MPDMNGKAIGVVADLFAEGVGYSDAWGFSRSIGKMSASLLANGNIIWKAADGQIAVALINTLATPSLSDLPEGVTAFGPELVAHVAIGQHYSGWAKVPGKRSSRLIQLRCHIGKERQGEKLANQVLIQYRVWTRSGKGKPKQVLEAAKAWPLLEDLHAAIVKCLT